MHNLTLELDGPIAIICILTDTFLNRKIDKRGRWMYQSSPLHAIFKRLLNIFCLDNPWTLPWCPHSARQQQLLTQTKLNFRGPCEEYNADVCGEILSHGLRVQKTLDIPPPHQQSQKSYGTGTRDVLFSGIEAGT